VSEATLCLVNLNDEEVFSFDIPR